MSSAPSDAVPLSLAFVGRSGSGKTTLLEKLVAELARRGVRVGVVKHTRHHVESDEPGTDTRRLWEAGAVHTALVTPDRAVHAHRYAVPPSLPDILPAIRGVDVVLVEGFKGEEVPKVEVVRAACEPHLLPDLRGRVACVTDLPDLPWEGPLFAPEDVEGLAAFVVSLMTGREDEDLASAAGLRPPISGMGGWEELDHTADLALRVWAPDYASFFTAAARGMFSLLADLRSIERTECRRVSLTAPDVETLLIDWLNELLYFGETEPVSAYADFDFDTLTSTQLVATVVGGPVTEYHTYIKAATFHNLEVRKTSQGYETEIVFDT
ncbi:MAG: molybdopterin-guanine dinucleotide biosynthesis protein B [Anaerolineales bacterium]